MYSPACQRRHDKGKARLDDRLPAIGRERPVGIAEERVVGEQHLAEPILDDETYDRTVQPVEHLAANPQRDELVANDSLHRLACLVKEHDFDNARPAFAERSTIEVYLGGREAAAMGRVPALAARRGPTP